MLFRIFGMYCKKYPGMHRPFWKTFVVDDAKWIKRQPPGTSLCGFYVMHYIHQYSGDDFSALEDMVRTNLAI